MQLGFWKLKFTARIGNKRISPYGMFDQPDQPTQFDLFPHLDPPYQQ
jgi:hypothetical protein